MTDLSTVTCPGCGHVGLRVEMRFRAKPIGTFSVAGEWPKVVADEWPYLVCDECGFAKEGKVDRG